MFKTQIRIAFAAAILAVTWSGPGVAAGPTPAEKVELARQYEYGETVPRNGKWAITLYCQAVSDGNADAAFFLGWMYLSGREVERDSAMAARWMARAAAGGHRQAIAVTDRFHLADDGVPPRCPAFALPEATVAAAPAQPARPIVAPKAVAKLVGDMAPKYGLDPKLVLAVIQIESAFRADAVSPKNAQGLIQVIPATAERFGVSNPMDVTGNLVAGMKYLRWLLSYFHGDVTLAAAAYNAGEGGVIAYRGIPPFPETQAYVKRLHSYYPATRHPFDPRVAAQFGRPWPELIAAKARPAL